LKRILEVAKSLGITQIKTKEQLAKELVQLYLTRHNGSEPNPDELGLGYFIFFSSHKNI